MTQVNITILKTYDTNVKYLFQAFANFLHSWFLRLRDWFIDMGLNLPWLAFLECLNRLIDIKRLVPPENVYHKIHGCICKHDDFKMGNWKVFDGMCNALHYKPQYLEQDEGFSKWVTLSPVLDFHFGQYEEWFVTVTYPKTACLQWMEGLLSSGNILISLDLCSKRWNLPIMIKNPCIIVHCTSNDELLRMIAIDKHLTQSWTHLYYHGLFS